MKRIWLALLAVAGLVDGLSAEPIKPVVEVRVKAVADLIPTVEYAGGLFGQADAAQQFAGVLKQFAANEKGFDGLDLTRPIGFYAGFAEKVEDSPLVLMLPIADEEAALDAAKSKLNLDLKKGDGGVYSADVPGVPGPVYLRFADKYAYVTIRSDAWVDAGKLITPKTFFADKSTAVLGATVRLDQIPADVKKTAYGQLELKLKENNANLNATAVQKLINAFMADVSVDAVKTVLMDGDKFTLTLDVDPKADDWKLAVGLTPKAGTTLEKTLAGFADRESAAAGVGMAVGAASKQVINFQLPPETAKKFAAVVEAVAKQAQDDAKESDKPVAKLFADALVPTLKAGDFQLGLRIDPPAAGKKAGGLMALKTVGGEKFGELATIMAVGLPKAAGTLASNTDAVGERKLHKLTLTNQEAVPFALDTVWFMTSADLFAASADAKTDPLKALTTAKPVKTPMFLSETSFTQAAGLSTDHTAEMRAKATKDVFGDTKPDGKDTLTVAARGGKAFELSVSMKGKGMAFLAALDRAKKGE
jgi:hypothetical protein